MEFTTEDLVAFEREVGKIESDLRLRIIIAARRIREFEAALAVAKASTEDVPPVDK